MADAMYRGAIVGARFGGRDLLTVDWFEFADRPLAEVRNLVGLPQVSERARAAGSAGPGEPGGISEFQKAAARQRAESFAE
ncbi:MAG: hypothetical protein ACLQPH_07755 [Acidimicrobiales bacterium]